MDFYRPKFPKFHALFWFHFECPFPPPKDYLYTCGQTPQHTKRTYFRGISRTTIDRPRHRWCSTTSTSMYGYSELPLVRHQWVLWLCSRIFPWLFCRSVRGWLWDTSVLWLCCRSTSEESRSVGCNWNWTCTWCPWRYLSKVGIRVRQRTSDINGRLKNYRRRVSLFFRSSPRSLYVWCTVETWYLPRRREVWSSWINRYRNYDWAWKLHFWSCPHFPWYLLRTDNYNIYRGNKHQIMWGS